MLSICTACGPLKHLGPETHCNWIWKQLERFWAGHEEAQQGHEEHHQNQESGSRVGKA
jgi:hypothetical protein